MNGHVCCILGVCCPSRSDQASALAEEMVQDLKCDADHASTMAQWILTHFDLAPAGTLAPYRDAVATFARTKKP